MVLEEQILFGICVAMILSSIICIAFFTGGEKEQKVRKNKVLQVITQNTVDSIRIDNEKLKCYMIITLTSGIEYVVSSETYHLNPDVIYLPNGTIINKNTIESMRRHYLGTGILHSQTHSSVELMNFPVFLVGDSETDIKKVYTEALTRETYRNNGRYIGLVDGNNISWGEDTFDSFWDVQNVIRNENKKLY